MRREIQHLLTLIFFTFYFGTVSAQDLASPFYTKVYKASDGLVDSYILNIYQDSRKYLWVGAYRGLSRFDGREFYNYGFRNGLPDLYINNFSEDNDGRVWVASRKGIGYIRGTNYYHTLMNDSLDVDFTYSFYRNSQGKLWALTSKGMYEWNDKIWVKGDLIARFANQPVRTIAESGDGGYYVVYYNHIAKVNPDKKYTIIDSNFSIMPYYGGIKKYGSFLYVTMQSGISRLVNDKLIPIFKGELDSLTLYGTLRDSSGRFWIATEEKGLLISDPGNEEHFRYTIKLPNNLVSNIFEDKDHNIWLAGFLGLVKVKEPFFKEYKPAIKGLVDIKRILKVRGGKYLAYDEENGFYEFNHDGIRTETNYTKSFYRVAKGREERYIHQLLPAEGNDLWAIIGTRKLLKIGPEKTKIISVLDGKMRPVPLINVAYNSTTNFFFASSLEKLYKMQQGKLVEFVSSNGVSIREPLRIFISNCGSTIVQTLHSGFYLIDKNDRVSLVSAQMQLKEFSTEVKFYDAPDNCFWVTIPGYGLRQYVWLPNGSFKLKASISTQQGLPSDVITSVCFDMHNRLWALTLSGVAVLESVTESKEGLIPMIIIDKNNYGFDVNINENFARMIADDDGKIWLSTGYGIVFFDPDQFAGSTEAPCISFEKILVNGQCPSWRSYADSVNGFFEMPSNASLPYYMNDINFYFKGVSFADEGNVFYSTKLEGAGNTWSPPSLNNTISVKFSPGLNTLYVKAKKANSDWSVPSKISININQPWWSLWWFRAIGIFITSAFLITIFRVRIKRIRRNSLFKEQLRDFEMKALKAQMNPHFIYNALNSIQSLVMDNRNEEAQNYMVKFSRLLRQVLHHSEENVITLERELASLKLYIELEALRLNYTLQFSIDVDENIVLEKEWLPPLILQPFVENALWHGLSRKEGSKRLAIKIGEFENMLICEIEDNGVGRKAKQGATFLHKEGPRGMEITKARLAGFNQQYTDDIVSVIDLRDEHGHPCGTRIVLRIKRMMVPISAISDR